MTSTAVAVREKVDGVIEQMRSEEFRAELAQVLPTGVTIGKFEQIVKTALLDDIARQREPGKMLISADPASLLLAAVKCAADGLVPDGREAALVKRGDQVAYQPMVKGFVKIAGQSDWTITAHVVCENDQFEYTVGTPPRHVPVRPGMERGAFIAVYAVARHTDGRHPVERVLYADEVAKRRKMATTQNVWNQWEEQQWQKTAVRDIFADLPVDPADRDRVVRVLRASELAPGDAAAALYDRRPSFGELPSGREPYVNVEISSESSGEGGGTSAAAESEQEPPAAQTPAPGGSASDDFGQEADSPAEPDPDDELMAAAQEAAGYVVHLTNHDSWAHGLTLAQIRADERHEAFFRWALTRASGPVKQHATAYARVQLPALLEAA